MKKKTYRISIAAEKELHEIMKNYLITTENKAVEHILTTYRQREKELDELKEQYRVVDNNLRDVKNKAANFKNALEELTNSI